MYLIYLISFDFYFFVRLFFFFSLYIIMFYIYIYRIALLHYKGNKIITCLLKPINVYHK